MNRYFEHRQEIKKACEELNVPAEVGTDIVRKRHEWSTLGTAGEELNEWRKMIRKHQLDKNLTLADLFGE